MFTAIKGYIGIAIGAIVLGFLAYVKYLRASNIEQKENIVRLKKEIVVQKLVSKDEAKREIFRVKQRFRSDVLKENEITIESIESEVKFYEINNINHSYDSVRV